ncbi:Ankyrin repeats (3 copies) [Popillia japonica]|uniref:Ankyrin repeats (3 copies) n=1 Tax=Popillia japonica TaxID=7064 RepID=A0AAW1L6H4_POPJA
MSEDLSRVPSPPPMPPMPFQDSPSLSKQPTYRRSQMFHLPSRLSFGHYSFNIRGYRRLEDEPLQKRASILLPHLQQSEKKFFELVQANDLQAVKEASILLPHLQQSEKKFFELVQANDLQAVKEFLQENHGFNINCVNFQGVSALHIAVQNRSESMVDFLLQQRDIDVGDCALHAIRDNQIKILQLLLDKLQEIAPGLEFVGVTHSSDFPDHVTPLILAAQCGHFEIIELLIERGHKISKPHLPNCSCSECLAHLDHDDLLHGETLRLNLYRAVTNPAYICHATHDPILSAFELSRELLLCSKMVPEFKAAYLELSQEISNFAVEIIAGCRSTEEMDLILKQQGGLNIPGHLIYPRLLLAMDYKQKQFVAHPNTQQMVEAVWHGDFNDWKFKSFIVQASYPFFRLALLPIVAIFCLILPKHSLVKHYSIPLNKMLTHIGAYFVFLVIIFLESNMSKKSMKRGPPNSGLEPIIILFVCSIIWGSFRLCMLKGPTRHFSKLWNWFDLVTYILYILTFSFWLAASIDVQQNDQVDLERKYWHHLDPTLIAEGTFAIAVVMSFFRLLHLVRLHYVMGPLQICLGKMSADVAKYLIIFALIILSFTCGTCRLYHYYDGMVQTDKATGVQRSQASSFVDFSSALKTYFWAIFTMSDLASGDVVIEALPGEVENTVIINEHTFTEAIGYIAFALFEILIVIILLNMLIATMSNTFQKVIDNVNAEWTFGKTDLYLDYIDQTVLPPPLNLIPTAQGLGAALEWIQVLTKTPPDRKARFTLSNCCYIEREVDEHITRDFPILMTQLIQRYFREKDVANENAVSDLEAVKQDIGEIKQLLRESLAPSLDLRSIIGE